MVPGSILSMQLPFLQEQSFTMLMLQNQSLLHKWCLRVYYYFFKKEIEIIQKSFKTFILLDIMVDPLLNLSFYLAVKIRNEKIYLIDDFNF